MCIGVWVKMCVCVCLWTHKRLRACIREVLHRGWVPIAMGEVGDAPGDWKGCVVGDDCDVFREIGQGRDVSLGIGYWMGMM